MMGIVNRLLNAIFAIMLNPFRDMSPWIGMTVVSLFTAIVVLVVFKSVSWPGLIRRKKNRLLARVLELVIFKDDIVVNMGAFGRVLWANLVYLVTLTIPLIVCMVVFIPLTSHVYARFGLRPFMPGETVMIKVQPAGWEVVEDTSVILDVPASVDNSSIVSVRVIDRNEVCWRFTAPEGKEIITAGPIWGTATPVRIGNGLTAVARTIQSDSTLYRVINPVDAPLLPEKDGIAKVHINYPEREMTIGGVEINWMLAYIVLTLVFGYALKGPLKVEI